MNGMLRFIAVKGGFATLAVLTGMLTPITLAAAVGTIGSLDIRNGQVKAVDLGKGAVTSAKIKAGAVKTKHIAAGAITAAKITGGAGSGLDADSVDGLQAADLVGKNGNQSINGEVQATDFKYPSLQYRYLMIPAAALVPVNNTIAYSKWDGSNYVLSSTSGGGPYSFLAPVNLPNKAVVSQFGIDGLDRSGNDIEASLLKGGTIYQVVMASISTAPQNGDIWKFFYTNTIADNTINNVYHYFVEVKLYGSAGADHKINYVRVRYLVPSPD